MAVNAPRDSCRCGCCSMASADLGDDIGIRKMRPRLLTLCLLLIVNAGRRAPRLIDYKLTRSDSEYFEKVYSAPIVVVGVILSDTLVRGSVPSRWDAQVLLQLFALRVTVRTTVRCQ